MDAEIAWLKAQLEDSTMGSIAQEGLKKLEEAIAAMQRVVEKTDKTHQRAEDLVSKVKLLLLGIQDLLEQLKGTSRSRLSTEQLSRMLTEAKKMVRVMELHSCSAQREAAEKEWEESHKLLLYIKDNASNQGEAIKITSMLKWYESKLGQLEAVLREAAENVGRATRQNGLNTPALEDVQQRWKDLGEEYDVVTGQIAMATGQLKNTAGLLKELGDLGMRYERLAAEFDGARTHLIKKVNVISQAASKEPIVVSAEKHARELNWLARELQDLVKNATKSSDVQRAIDVAGAYKNITEAVRAAGQAARQAMEAAEEALSDVKREDLPKRARNLKDQAYSLLTKAQDARNDHKRTADEQATQGKRVDQARSKTETLQKDLQTAMGELAKIKRGRFLRKKEILEYLGSLID
ncbi:hypothetical protein AAFF_G00014250 [Aldrovandia affinis]|uniref:Laminin alpha domain-containing protein n=1 Tax=Aldrovandia affinis TaxID=143900 RepID=A0AAD7S6E6_9TELE|nr:hypothetical protein AAFF_G00014250 [Aldrovandia affinis]